jgi:NAD(P)-dependent dehydrogenase (short-subunit alcohol dehydrogenase family)
MEDLMTSLENRHIALIGGSTGIGLATGRLLAGRGARLTIGARGEARLSLKPPRGWRVGV